MVHLRVFIASPGDVIDERNLARQLLSEELPRVPAFRGRVTFDPVTSDDPAAQTAMLAGEQPQASVIHTLPRPADCDLLIVILWSRMGTPLPETERKPNGDRYLSGTEWEYEDARNSEKKPPVLIYRRTGQPKVELNDPDIDAKREQLRKVEHFFSQFRNPDGSMSGGYNSYANPKKFKELLRQHLEQWVWQDILKNRNEDASARPDRPHRTQPDHLLQANIGSPEEQARDTSGPRPRTPRLVLFGAVLLVLLGAVAVHWVKIPSAVLGSPSVPSESGRSPAGSETTPQSRSKLVSGNVGSPKASSPPPPKETVNADHKIALETPACAEMHEIAGEIRRTYSKADHIELEGVPTFSDRPGAEGDPWAGRDIWKTDLIPHEGTLCRQIVSFTEAQNGRAMASEAAALWVLRSGKWMPSTVKFRSQS